MRVIQIVSLTILFFFFACSPMYGDPILLVTNKRANSEIVIPPDASLQIKDISVFLQTYIEKSTGAKLPIVIEPTGERAAIHIGNTSLISRSDVKISSKNDEAFIIDIVNEKNIVLLGNTDWGTEYAVYDFLERFVGIQWLMPTELGEEIPNHTSLSILISSKIEDEPAFLTRRLAPLETEKPRNQFDSWARINRIKKNIEFTHNLTNLFNEETFGAEDRRFYPLINGKRGIDQNKKHDWQPNFNDDKIVEVASERIIDYFKKNPGKKSYSLGINDSKNFDRSTESIKRRPGRLNSVGFEDASDEYFNWANAVAKKVNSIFPDKNFGALAYNNVFDPPSKSIGVNKNIVPFITNERIRWSNPDFKQKDIAHTKGWLEVSKNVGWYDYVYGNTYMAPRVWPHLMGEYLKWGHENGVKYYVAELYPNWGEGPKVWLLSKLLWNPYQDVDSLLNTWYVKFAGEQAAPKLKEYYELWEKFWREDIQKSEWYNDTSQYLPLTNLRYILDIPNSYIEKSDALLTTAYNSAKLSIHKERIAKMRRMWDIYKMTILYKKNNPSRYWNMQSLKVADEVQKALRGLRKDSLYSQISIRLLDGYINR